MTVIKAIAALGCAALLTAAAHDSDQAALAKALDGRVPGQPVDCIDPHFMDGPIVIDKRTILYRDGATVYRNDLAAECRPLSPSATIILEINGGQLCRHDRFRTREPGDVIASEYCFLGSFTPYTKSRR